MHAVTPRQYFHILNMKYSEMTSTERRLALKCCHDDTIFLNFYFHIFCTKLQNS